MKLEDLRLLKHRKAIEPNRKPDLNVNSGEFLYEVWVKEQVLKMTYIGTVAYMKKDPVNLCTFKVDPTYRDKVLVYMYYRSDTIDGKDVLSATFTNAHDLYDPILNFLGLPKEFSNLE
jgi:hypothetical protein